MLMTAKPTYKLWQHLLIGGLASALIQPSAFYGSFIVRYLFSSGRLERTAHKLPFNPQDCLVSIPLGMLLVLIQVLVSRNDLYSSLFE